MTIKVLSDYRIDGNLSFSQGNRTLTVETTGSSLGIWIASSAIATFSETLISSNVPGQFENALTFYRRNRPASGTLAQITTNVLYGAAFSSGIPMDISAVAINAWDASATVPESKIQISSWYQSAGVVGLQIQNLTVSLPTNSQTLDFTGTSSRITGVFGTLTTQSQRTLFQTNQANASTVLGIIPNGSGTTSTMRFYSTNTPDSGCAMTQIGNAAGTTIFDTNQFGGGTVGNMELRVAGVAKVVLDNTGLFNLTPMTHGEIWQLGMATESLTLNTGATFTDTSANLLPANSIIEAVMARITTTITTAVSWNLGDGVTNARFSSNDSNMTAGETVVGLNHYQGSVTADSNGPVQISAAPVRIRLNANPGAGVVRITVIYRKFTGPTS